MLIQVNEELLNAAIGIISQQKVETVGQVVYAEQVIKAMTEAIKVQKQAQDIPPAQ